MNLNPSFLIQMAQNARIIQMKKESTIISKTKRKKRIKEMTEGQELTKLLGNLLLDEIIDQEIEENIEKILKQVTTEKAFELQNFNKNFEREKQGYETDLDEKEEYLDPFRKETMKQWKTIKSRFEWRWEWLQFKINELENELQEIDDDLQEKELKSLVESKIINCKEYSPQERREDIINHPLFSYQQKYTFTNEKISKEDMISSFKIYTNTYKKKDINEKKKRERKKKTTQVEYDINDIIIPWNDIRSNIVIPEIKTKEILTPKWRTPQEMKELMFLEEDEDTSDEKYCELHMPLEIEERKKYLKKQNQLEKEKLEKDPTTIILEKFNRSWTQVTKESYISSKIEDPKQGNWDSIPVYKPIEETEKVNEVEKEVVKRKRKTIYYEDDFGDENLVFYEDDEEYHEKIYKSSSSSDFDVSEERKRKKKKKEEKKKKKSNIPQYTFISSENPLKFIIKLETPL